MKKPSFVILGWILLNGLLSHAQLIEEKENLYLISGQGSDERVFKNLTFDTTLFDIHYIKYEIPEKHENLKSYALRLSSQIDTTKVFSLIGVSLGGMIATEINEALRPSKVIIISSAKCRSELPLQYRFQKSIPIYKIIPKRLIKQSAFIAQPLFEPDRKKEKETCKAMLRAKDPTFLKRTIAMIIKWDRVDFDQNILHIHGDNDHTLPVRNIDKYFLIINGSHMMVLTQAEEINKLLLHNLTETDQK